MIVELSLADRQCIRSLTPGMFLLIEETEWTALGFWSMQHLSPLLKSLHLKSGSGVDSGCKDLSMCNGLPSDYRN